MLERDVAVRTASYPLDVVATSRSVVRALFTFQPSVPRTKSPLTTRFGPGTVSGVGSAACRPGAFSSPTGTTKAARAAMIVDLRRERFMELRLWLGGQITRSLDRLVGSRDARASPHTSEGPPGDANRRIRFRDRGGEPAPSATPRTRARSRPPPRDTPGAHASWSGGTPRHNAPPHPGAPEPRGRSSCGRAGGLGRTDRQPAHC